MKRADEKWRQELATKSDLIEQITGIRVEMQSMRNDFIERIAAVENRLIKWMMGGFIAFGAFLFAAMAFLK